LRKSEKFFTGYNKELVKDIIEVEAAIARK
jgi:hypothetical protein